MSTLGARAVAAVSGLLLVVTLGATSKAVASESDGPIPADTDADYQLGGAWDGVPRRVGIVVRDRTDEPLAGRHNVCYVNGFQTQPHERRWWERHHWWLVLKRDGRPVVDSAWGEWLLDVRTHRKRTALARIVQRWVAGCAADGFDSVEYDNLDSFTRSRGLLHRRDAVRYAARLVRLAHEAGLPAAQKNLADFDGTRIGFDFAVAESCARWRECRAYAAAYGDQVIAVEYGRRDFRRACRLYGDRWPVVRRDRALRPGGVHAWC